MTEQSKLPLVILVVVVFALIGMAYANVTGMLELSGAEVINETTATGIVVVLFLLMLPWAYRRSKSS